ncbi:hypothetical protein [Myroides odoratus]|uniref:hypothetical protein n=1 Tax=Myroides odoratus TaxID=256 RepID=UPI0039AF4834
MKKILLLVFTLFLLGGTVGFAKTKPTETTFRTETDDKFSDVTYAVVVIDLWNNNTIVYEEGPYCGFDRAVEKAIELQDLYDSIYPPGRFSANPSPRLEPCTL